MSSASDPQLEAVEPDPGVAPDPSSDQPIESPESEQDAFDGVPPALLRAIQRRGFTSLTAVQRAVLDADDGRRDLRISSQTGSGKTVALGFALASRLEQRASERPAGPSTLVVTPTRELANQVQTELAWLFHDMPWVRVEVVTGGTNVGAERSRLSRRPALVVGTPGRLLDHASSGALDLTEIAQVVLDEADQMLDLGFKDELDGILGLMPDDRRAHLVSATFPKAVLELANRFQRDALQVEGTALGAAHADIEHIAHALASPKDRYRALVNLLLYNGDERALVFVRTREDASTVADKLAADGFAALPIHGDLAQAQRTRTLDAFRKGTVRILVATDVAARGLDIADVSAVLHTSPPIDAATYVHRSGRTGRAGQKGRSVMLVPAPRRGRAAQLYREAGVRFEWQPIPTLRDVSNRQLARAEAKAMEALDAQRDSDRGQRKIAARLLQDRDPIEVVAAMLVQSSVGARKPFPFDPPEQVPPPNASPRHGPGERTGPAPRGRDRDGSAGFSRFTINWGFKNGGEARRILAHICRRGELRRDMVGAISVGPFVSTFEVRDDMAKRFSRRAQIRDRRDPHLVIAPAGSRGSRPS
jgi:ATP-dependent RNA helicase DeaD